MGLCRGLGGRVGGVWFVGFRRVWGGLDLLGSMISLLVLGGLGWGGGLTGVVGPGAPGEDLQEGEVTGMFFRRCLERLDVGCLE